MEEWADTDWQSDVGMSQSLGTLAQGGGELLVYLSHTIFLSLGKVGTHVSAVPGVTSMRGSS